MKIRLAAACMLLAALTACGVAPEDEGYEYGQTLDPLPGIPLLDGLSNGQRAACAAEAVIRYQEDTDQEAFHDGCLKGARRY